MANITLDVHIGDALTEMVRVYLKTGNPSAMFSRLVQGVDKYIRETTNVQDRRYGMVLRSQLDALSQEWLAKETKDSEGEFVPVCTECEETIQADGKCPCGKLVASRKAARG